jgi:polyisoprenoid-binding protein YceI
MKKILFFASISAFVLAQSAFTADTYVFDKNHSTMGFQVRHLFSKVPGKFDDFDGKIQFDEGNPENSSVEVTIKTASVDTGVAMRDENLRSAEFFDVEKFPEITFKSKS